MTPARTPALLEASTTMPASLAVLASTQHGVPPEALAKKAPREAVAKSWLGAPATREAATPGAWTWASVGRFHTAAQPFLWDRQFLGRALAARTAQRREQQAALVSANAMVGQKTDVVGTGYAAMIAAQKELQGPALEVVSGHRGIVPSRARAGRNRQTNFQIGGGDGNGSGGKPIKIESNTRQAIQTLFSFEGKQLIETRVEGQETPKREIVTAKLSFSQIESAAVDIEGLMESTELNQDQENIVALAATIESLRSNPTVFNLALDVLYASMPKTARGTPITPALSILKEWASVEDGQENTVGHKSFISALLVLGLQNAFTAEFSPNAPMTDRAFAQIPQRRILAFITNNLFDLPGRNNFNALVGQRLQPSGSASTAVDLRAAQPAVEDREPQAAGSGSSDIKVDPAGSSAQTGDGQGGGPDSGPQ